MRINLRNWLLDLILPRTCLGCGQENFYICQKCYQTLPVMKHLNCYLCGARSPKGHICQNCQNKFHPALKGLFVASDWDNLFIREIIYAYKYNFIKELSDPLSCLMVDFLNLHFRNELNEKTLLVPVPLHKRRLLWRGFNQSELIAQKISATLNIQKVNCLKRIKNTLPQAGIKDRRERHRNVAGAFQLQSDAQKEIFKNANIILVDDVCTTTATLEECANALRPCGPSKIYGLVLARG